MYGRTEFQYSDVLFCVMFYLLFKSVFQTFIVQSEDAEMVFEPFVVMATALTAAKWPFKM